MKIRIGFTNAEKEVISNQAKDSKISNLVVNDELICNAIITSFYKQNYITEAECAIMRNQINTRGTRV